MRKSTDESHEVSPFPPTSLPPLSATRQRTRHHKAQKKVKPFAWDFQADAGINSGLNGTQDVPDEVQIAAKSFSERHLYLSTEAQALLNKAGRASSNPQRDELAFNLILDEMRRNRVYLDTHTEAVASPGAKSPGAKSPSDARRKKRMKRGVDQTSLSLSEPLLD